MQSGSIVSAPMRLDDDLDVVIECDQKAKQALHGKLPELSPQHLGYIGLPDTKQIRSLDLSQAAIFHDGVDFEYELCLDQVLLGIRDPVSLNTFRLPVSYFLFIVLGPL
jgi:hypothetical protein